MYSVRMQCGRVLATESPVEADIVSSVPESGTAAAHGYARQVNSINLSDKTIYVQKFVQIVKIVCMHLSAFCAV